MYVEDVIMVGRVSVRTMGGFSATVILHGRALIVKVRKYF